MNYKPTYFILFIFLIAACTNSKKQADPCAANSDLIGIWGSCGETEGYLELSIKQDSIQFIGLNLPTFQHAYSFQEPDMIIRNENDQVQDTLYIEKLSKDSLIFKSLLGGVPLYERYFFVEHIEDCNIPLNDLVKEYLEKDARDYCP